MHNDAISEVMRDLLEAKATSHFGPVNFLFKRRFPAVGLLLR